MTDQGRYVWMPDDWQAVPKVATEEIVTAITTVRFGDGDIVYSPGCRRASRGYYSAALAAAPSLPEAPATTIVTETAQRTAMQWLNAQLEMAKRSARFVSGEGEHAEILVTILALMSAQPKLPSEEMPSRRYGHIRKSGNDA